MKVVIPKGRHWPTIGTRLRLFPFFKMNVKAIKVSFVVTKSMMVFHKNQKCMYDSNKLGGICDGLFTDHHKNSNRISYVPHLRGEKLSDADCLQILHYDYVDGKVVMDFQPKLYRVGDRVEHTYVLPKAIKIGRILPPYHGGNCPTTQKVTYTFKMELL